MGCQRGTPSWRNWSSSSRPTTPKDKLLVFTQFADTARYLKSQLVAALGIKNVEEATGQSADPTALAWRFSPESNGKRDQGAGSG
jgi:hypothetical protein